ncbi:MAG: leucine-rich repeat protein, partial [Ruminococcus sp.]|nr:leucine-rich repeat protein [Ruminococcus sp.]
MKKKILSITLALCLAFASSAALPQSAFTDTAGISATALTSGDFEYSLLNDGTAEITGYKGSKADLTIPSIISGNTVTSIGTGAFLVNTSLKSLTIPKTIKTIGFSAVSGCMNLKTVTIENGVETIDSMAFSGNTALENVTIPSSVTKIGSYAFSSTKWLDDQKKKSPFVIVNEILIDASGCEAAVVIPDTVKTIGSAAFKDLAISSVTFPESIETIDELAFFNCKNLKSVTIPQTVKTIGKEALGYIKLDNGLSAVMKDFAIYGKNKTGAQKYASSNAITFYNKLDTIRLAGKDRYETAVEISKYRSTVFYESSTVILANGMNYADALAAASLARYYHAPILLTNTHSLNP